MVSMSIPCWMIPIILRTPTHIERHQFANTSTPQHWHTNNKLLSHNEINVSICIRAYRTRTCMCLCACMKDATCFRFLANSIMSTDSVHDNTMTIAQSENYLDFNHLRTSDIAAFAAAAPATRAAFLALAEAVADFSPAFNHLALTLWYVLL